MNCEIIPAASLSLGEQALIANAAFANYIAGWAEMDAESLARFLLLQGADQFYSRFARTEEGPAGFGYINRTGDILRLGAMALIPSARGTGAADRLLLHLFDEAKARGDATMVLEVIEQNPRAVALYRRHGFREISRLFGWRRSGKRPRTHVALPVIEEMPILDALRLPTARYYPDIPWSISPLAIAKVERTYAFRVGDAAVVISDPNVVPLRVHGLFSNASDSEELRPVLAAVLDQFAEHEFFAPPVWPEEFGRDVFAPLGFEPEPLSQFLMRRDF